MKRETTITITMRYRWWNATDDDKEVNTRHTQALEEEAEEHIAEMTKDGYTSGVLCANIRIDDSDGEDGVEYRGWWEYNKA